MNAFSQFSSQTNRLFVFDVFFSQSSSVYPRSFVTTSGDPVLSDTSRIRALSPILPVVISSIEDQSKIIFIITYYTKDPLNFG